MATIKGGTMKVRVEKTITAGKLSKMAAVEFHLVPDGDMLREEQMQAAARVIDVALRSRGREGA